MGRAERRKAERQYQRDSKKDKILISREELTEMRRNIADSVSEYSVEALLTCFALTERQLYGFGSKRVLRTLEHVDMLFGRILKGEVTMDEYAKLLEDEVGIAVRTGNKNKNT